MINKKVKLRILFLSFSLLLAILVIFLVLKSLEKNVVYFFSPSEIFYDEGIDLNKKIRIGGLVKENSLVKNEFNNTYIFFINSK